jgi:hypothetical protein
LGGLAVGRVDMAGKRDGMQYHRMGAVAYS